MARAQQRKPAARKPRHEPEVEGNMEGDWQEEVRQLEARLAELKGKAKSAALDKAQAAVDELNQLGFSYRLVEGGAAAPKTASGRQGTRQVQDRECPVCQFKTIPPHDKRAHRSQSVKAPFSDSELQEKGMRKA